MYNEALARIMTDGVSSQQVRTPDKISKNKISNRQRSSASYRGSKISTGKYQKREFFKSQVRIKNSLMLISYENY